MTSLSRLRDKRLNGYRRAHLTSDLDSIVDAVVSEYWESSRADRKHMLDEMKRRAAGVLTAYGERMAAISVRTGSLTSLNRGLVGSVADPHDTCIVLAAVNHSATLLGSSLGSMATDLADVLPPRAIAVFSDFAERDDRDKSLSSMGLRVIGSGPTFRYGSGSTGR